MKNIRYFFFNFYILVFVIYMYVYMLFFNGRNLLLFETFQTCFIIGQCHSFVIVYTVIWSQYFTFVYLWSPCIIRADKISMALLFWYLVISNFLQGTTRPCLTGNPVTNSKKLTRKLMIKK